MKRTKHGFTLVELIIVIAVIGVLAAILIPTFANVIDKANAKSALSDARNTVTQYITDAFENQSLPENIVVIVKKAGNYYLYGYNASGDGSIQISSGNPYKGLNSVEDLINEYSWNAKQGEDAPNTNTEYTEADTFGTFYLVPYVSGIPDPSVSIKGFHAGKADVDMAKYPNLKDRMSENMGEDTDVFHGILLPGQFTLDTGANGSGTGTGNGDNGGSTTFTITYDINLPNDVTATVGGAPVKTEYIVNKGADHPLQGTPTASNNDYTFAGWYENDIQVTAQIPNVTRNHTLTAKWETLNRYSITIENTWDGHPVTIGGEPADFVNHVWSDAPETTVVNTIINDLTATLDPVVEGVEFNGWMLKFGSNDAIAYNSETSYPLTANLVISPVFGKKDCTLTFKVGDSVFETQNVLYGEKDIALPTHDDSATDGHFNGWEFSGTTYNSNYPNPVTGDMTFTASFGWYSVKFYDPNGNEITTTHTGDTYTIPTPECDVGHHHTGWTLSAGADPATCPMKGTYTANKNDITITATEAINTYTVKFMKGYEDGTDGVLKTQEVEHGQPATAPTGFTRDGYEFTGWDNDFSNITENTTVTAQWKPIPVGPSYTLTFDCDGGTFEPNGTTAPNGAPATATMTLPEKTDISTYVNKATASKSGMTFAGWNYGEDMFSATLPLAKCEITENITFTAKYVNSSNVIYDQDTLNKVNTLEGLTQDWLVTKDFSLESKHYPLGWTDDADVEFTGTFYGNGHKISNIGFFYETGSMGGLFAIIGESGAVRDINLNITKMELKHSLGGVCGKSKGTIINVHVNISDEIVSGYYDNNGFSNLGGIVGITEGGEIIRCSVTGKVHSYEGTNACGGLVGGICGSHAGGRISQCWFSGSITDSLEYWNAGGYYYVGGFLVGGIAGQAWAPITNCWADITRATADNYLGGIAGGVGGSSGRISSCWAYLRFGGINSSQYPSSGSIKPIADHTAFSKLYDSSIPNGTIENCYYQSGSFSTGGAGQGTSCNLDGATAATCPGLPTTYWGFNSGKPYLLNNH